MSDLIGPIVGVIGIVITLAYIVAVILILDD